MSQRQRQNRKRSQAAAAATPGPFGTAVHPHAADIDVGASELVAAIAPGSRPSAPRAEKHARRDARL